MSSSDSIHSLVQSQFAPSAAQYAGSLGHADPAVLARIFAFTDPKATDRVLDVASGPGHTGLAFAPSVAEVTFLDLTAEMLEQVHLLAEERQLTNIATIEAAAEEIPFPAASFDLVTVRLAPHHFTSVPHFLNEAHRVLAPGGRLLVVDTVAPEDLDLDEQLNEIEALRDPSHVRNYRPSEWREMLADAGFESLRERLTTFADGFRMEFEDWTKRIRQTDARALAELRKHFAEASPELIEVMKIQPEGETFTFELPEFTILAARL